MSTPEDRPEETPDYHTIDDSTANELRAAQPDPDSFDSLSHTIKGLSNATRLKILAYLKQQDLCVHDLAALLNLSQSAVSHQLKQLNDRNLLNRRKEGRVVYYSLNESGVESLIDDLRTIVL